MVPTSLVWRGGKGRLLVDLGSPLRSMFWTVTVSLAVVSLGCSLLAGLAWGWTGAILGALSAIVVVSVALYSLSGRRGLYENVVAGNEAAAVWADVLSAREWDGGISVLVRASVLRAPEWALELTIPDPAIRAVAMDVIHELAPHATIARPRP